MTDDLLRELGKELPYEQPDDARRDAVRASLLTAASRREELPPQRWRVFAAFGAGALAAAAIAMVVIGRRAPVAPAVESARIESSAAAELEHTVATTASGSEEIVRVHAGVIRVALAPAKAGDRVAIVTADAEIAGAGAYEVTVRADKLAAVTVTSGAAKIAVTGHQAVFLAAGETWHSEIWTAETQLQPAKSEPAPPVARQTTNERALQNLIAGQNNAISAVDSMHRDRGELAHGAAPQVAATASTPPPAAMSSVAPPAIPTRKPAASPAITTARPDAPPAITIPKPDAPPAMTTPKPDAPPTSTPPSVATSVTRPVESHPAVTAPSPNPPSQTEQHFQRGWRLLKDGKAIEAASELGIAAEGDGPIAIDARYFQAEALVKAGRKTEAEKALVGFLDHAQQSLRRGRAAVMLARLIAERGDKAAARNWFQSAVGDPDPAVAAAAKAGLAAL